MSLSTTYSVRLHGGFYDGHLVLVDHCADVTAFKQEESGESAVVLVYKRTSLTEAHFEKEVAVGVLYKVVLVGGIYDGRTLIVDNMLDVVMVDDDVHKNYAQHIYARTSPTIAEFLHVIYAGSNRMNGRHVEFLGGPLDGYKREITKEDCCYNEDKRAWTITRPFGKLLHTYAIDDVMMKGVLKARFVESRKADK